MKNNFEMSMIGELKFFLGLQVHQSPRGIFISQSQYAIEFLKKHGLDECVSISTPMETKRLDADLQGTPTDQTTYCRMIGGLMYLTASRPDIAFATLVCARYQARPTVKHLKEVKRNMGLWYLKDSGFELIAYSDADHAGCKDDCKSTPMETERLDADLQGTPTDQTTYRRMIGGLMYLTASRPDISFATFPKDFRFKLIAYLDADHTGCKDDCKRTSGGLQFLGGKLVSWSSKKLDCTAMSTAKAEYVSLSACCAQVIWMRTQLLDYGYKYNRIPMYCDSKSVIC
ncbi:retrovirus-related pol polyprotein from transposon TNT 1-94 [Tanacetum coccineum]